MDAENCGHREFCKRRYRPRQLKCLTEDCPATGIVRLWNSLWSCVNTAFAERLVTCLVDGGGHAELFESQPNPHWGEPLHSLAAGGVPPVRKLGRV